MLTKRAAGGVFFLKLLVLETVHLGDIDCPRFDDDEDEKTEEEGKRGSTRLAHGIPHLLVPLEHHLSRALWPVREEGESTDDDDGDEQDEVSPSHVLCVKGSAHVDNVNSAETGTIVEGRCHQRESDERDAHDGQCVEDGLDHSDIIQILRVGKEIDDSLICEVEEGESALLGRLVLFVFHFVKGADEA